MANQSPDISTLDLEGLKQLVLELMQDNAQLRAEIVFLREEVAHLKGLKGRPDIKPPSPPSGMEKGTSDQPNGKERSQRRRGTKQHRVAQEDRVIAPVNVPAGSRFKGYEDFTVQDLRIQARVIRFRRERWITADGRTIIASLPTGVDNNVGPELKRFILVQYHQMQTTIPRLVTLLHAFGLDVSKRQIVRLLTEGHDAFMQEARDVLRSGLRNANWIAADDTGARHKGQNRICTQIGNHAFTFFATTLTKSRANFLHLLRAGYADYVLNDQAFEYMCKRNLSDTVIALLAAHPQRRFADDKAWHDHLQALGIAVMRTNPNPTMITTEGALWGSIIDHDFLDGTIVLSDDAGQFNISDHALCWVHAERLIYKLNAFCDKDRDAKEQVRAAVWELYKGLKAYKLTPDPKTKTLLTKQFNAIFKKRTGFTALDRLLVRLYANKSELLKVLKRPEVPLHNNLSENDIRCQVTRRKISGTTRSDKGRDCRDTFLGLIKTCSKHGILFWDYLGDRFGLSPPGSVPPLANLVAARC
jgi:hypothetical protein